MDQGHMNYSLLFFFAKYTEAAEITIDAPATPSAARLVEVVDAESAIPPPATATALTLIPAVATASAHTAVIPATTATPVSSSLHNSPPSSLRLTGLLSQ